MSEVQRFFKEKHDGHYKIYNLCAEKTYEPEKFNHNTAWYPFEDHNAAPMQTIEDICKDLHKYLNNDKKNVAAIHCKAGKGRSGLIIACYLLYSGECHTAEEALVVFAAKRTSDGKGVTIPSQVHPACMHFLCMNFSSGNPASVNATSTNTMPYMLTATNSFVHIHLPVLPCTSASTM
eukprot:1392931-Amorphochlora_amoeboformis.AAC.2